MQETDSYDADWYQPVLNKLIQRRRDLGLSQTDVDALIGCADNLVSKWEGGSRRPRMQSLYHWAQALDFEVRLVPLPQ